MLWWDSWCPWVGNCLTDEMPDQVLCSNDLSLWRTFNTDAFYPRCSSSWCACLYCLSWALRAYTREHTLQGVTTPLLTQVVTLLANTGPSALIPSPNPTSTAKSYSSVMAPHPLLRAQLSSAFMALNILCYNQLGRWLLPWPFGCLKGRKRLLLFRPSAASTSVGMCLKDEHSTLVLFFF